MTEQYSERVNRIFERINNIQANVEDEKQNRLRFIIGLIGNFENRLKEMQSSKMEKFQILGEKIQMLQAELADQNTNRSKLENDLECEIARIEKDCKRTLEAYSAERADNEKKLFQKLSQNIDNLSVDIQREGINVANSGNYLLQFLEEDLPRLQDEIAGETAVRSEIEQKIYEQFMEQIAELRLLFEEEKRDREFKEEELINTLKLISQKVQEAIMRTKVDREKTEEHLLKLIEQVVDKLKKEMIDDEL